MAQCNCDRFEYLVGAATRTYTSDFLERTGTDDASGDVYYRCRVCSTPWKRIESKDSQTAKLIKLPKSAMA